MKEVYLDNAATTRLSGEVVKDMNNKLDNVYGNASTFYKVGRIANQVLEDSRHIIGQSINANDNEIVFTSGGTESDNDAILKTAETRKFLGNHIITTSIEHDAVLKPMKYLEKQGFKVTYLPVNNKGEINLDDLKSALDDETILVSIMMLNNEVGSHMPIHEIGEILKNHQAWFHTDAVQAYGLININVKEDHIDLLSTSAHKINGPKMTGFLYQSNGIKLPSFVLGGEQESKRRAGTENIPSISGFATAVQQLSNREKKAQLDKYNYFKNKIIKELKKNDIEVEVNGSLEKSQASHILNLWIKGISTYVLQTNLDLEDIAVSGGSACTAGSIEPSHVLTAMFGKNSSRISESIRISFGIFNTELEINYLIKTMVRVIKRVQQRQGSIVR